MNQTNWFTQNRPYKEQDRIDGILQEISSTGVGWRETSSSSNGSTTLRSTTIFCINNWRVGHILRDSIAGWTRSRDDNNECNKGWTQILTTRLSAVGCTTIVWGIQYISNQNVFKLQSECWIRENHFPITTTVPSTICPWERRKRRSRPALLECFFLLFFMLHDNFYFHALGKMYCCSDGVV